MTTNLRDTEFMQRALELAKKAFALDEVPVGALIISCKGEILAEAYNETELLQKVSAHAEIRAIEAASKKINNWRLAKCTLYSTLEPCPMCMGAIQLARIERVVWAAPDLRLGACGTFIDLNQKKHPFHRVKCEGGLLEKESSELLRSFFKGKR